MNQENIVKYSTGLIRLFFYLLFFLVPLVFLPVNFELFEYNKMMLTYFLTAGIMGLFLIKSVAGGKLIVKKTPFDIPIILFLCSQIISTWFSLDRHVSLLGYYSRFHGGLLSTIAYIILFYVFVSEYNDDLKYIFRILGTTLTSGFLVASYGILEKLGIDKAYWIQDVQNRVFSTLGQPNWLAAYLSVLLIIAFALSFNEKSWKKLILLGLSFLFYLVIIFTKSRSGFVGLWSGLLITQLFLSFGLTYLFISLILLFLAGAIKFFNLNLLPSAGKILNSAIEIISLANLPLLIIYLRQKFKGLFNIKLSKIVLVFTFLLLLISFLFGTPFSQFEQFTLKGIKDKMNKSAITTNQLPTPSGTALEAGGTESGSIRKIVWSGAIEIFKHYPLFGTGVETYAYAYYQFRPQAHNMTSEWDYLYNKAHNEYLNFLATSGIFGLTSYLLLIMVFITWTIRTLIKKTDHSYIIAGLLGAYVSILISNFFGFSVVVIGIFFFLIPAICLILTSYDKGFYTITILASSHKQLILSSTQKTLMLVILGSILFLNFSLIRMWVADKNFSSGYNLIRNNDYIRGYEYLKKAVDYNPKEPVFKEQLALSEAYLSIAGYQQNEKELSEKLKTLAMQQGEELTTDYPKNINFWKTRTKILYTLSDIDSNLTKQALDTLIQTWKLAPNDTKIAYNVGLLYAKTDQQDNAFSALLKSISLKPDYYEPRYALALLYSEAGQKEKAREQLNYILEKIRPNDKVSLDKLKELE